MKYILTFITANADHNLGLFNLLEMNESDFFIFGMEKTYKKK